MGRDEEKTVAEKKGENTSIYVQKQSGKQLEDMGYGDQGASTAYNQAVSDAAKHHDLKKEKKTDLKNKVREIREEAEKWGIPEHDIGL